MKILYYYNLRNRLRTKNEDSTFYLKPPYYALLASEYLNTKQVSTMYFPIFWRHFISKIVIRDTYWKKWGVFSTKIEF